MGYFAGSIGRWFKSNIRLLEDGLAQFGRAIEKKTPVSIFPVL